MIRLIAACAFVFMAGATSAAAQQRWVVDRPGSDPSPPCRAAAGFSDLGGGNVAFLSPTEAGNKSQTFAIAFHSTGEAFPAHGAKVSGVLQVDGSGLIALDFKLSVLEDATALIAPLPAGELLELLKAGRNLNVLLSGIGQLDVGLTGSRKALEKWETCIAEAVVPVPKPSVRTAGRPWVGIWAERKAWCERDVGLDGGPVEYTETAYSALDTGCEITAILDGGEKTGLVMICQREDMRSTELHTLRVKDDILSVDDEALFFRC